MVNLNGNILQNERVAFVKCAIQLEISLSKEELHQIEHVVLDEERLKRAIHREYLTCMQSQKRSFELVSSFNRLWRE